MPHRESPAPKVGLDLVRQPQQAQRIRDRAPITADAPRELFLGPAELGEELLIRLGFLDRVQVFPKQVLHECELETLGVGGIANDRGNPVEPGLACCTPTPLARDELVARAFTPHDDGLDHSRGFDRSRQLI